MRVGERGPICLQATPREPTQTDAPLPIAAAAHAHRRSPRAAPADRSAPSAVDLVEQTVEPEVIQPPRPRPTWRQVPAVPPPALAAVIQALGSALRGFASVLLRRPRALDTARRFSPAPAKGPRSGLAGQDCC